MARFEFDFTGRISRDDLARDPLVWRVYAVTFALFAAWAVLLPVVWPMFSADRLRPAAAFAAAVAVAALLTKPPPIDHWRNHAVILAGPVWTALAIVGLRPWGVIVVPAAMFAATFTAGRMRDRKRLLALSASAGIILALPSVLFTLDKTTIVALFSMIPAMWAVTICTMLILDAAEAQGEVLRVLIRRDPLTGVGNRRELSEQLAHQIARHSACGTSFSLLALDLDGFKELNDRFGHDAGDELLRWVGARLSDTVGSAGIVIRQGGDEFCVVLPEASALAALSVGRDVRSALADVGDGVVQVRTGIGVATYPHDGETEDALLASADARLVENKSRSKGASTVRGVPRSGGELVPAALGPESSDAGQPMPFGRSEIAVNSSVWRATAGSVAFFAVIVAGYLRTSDITSMGALTLCLGLILVATTMFAVAPPRLGSRLNHVILVVPYVGSALAILILPGLAGAAIAAVGFTGHLTAVRLVDRRQIFAHLFAASALLVAVIASAVALPIALALGLSIVLMWGIGIADLVYYEAAETEGRELEALVQRDPLTGAGNRRLLDERLTRELDAHARTHRSLTVLALDLNGFKKLNDLLGHAAGDTLLRDVATMLRTYLRAGDTVVRQGGDEFCVLLPETTAEQAVGVAHAIRRGIATLGSEGVPISTGLGQATFPVDGKTADELLRSADAELLRDKLSGPRRYDGVEVQARA